MSRGNFWPVKDPLASIWSMPWREMKFRRSARLANIDSRKTEIDFLARFFVHDAVEIGGASRSPRIGGGIRPRDRDRRTHCGAAVGTLGTASVHGLIKTLFPVSQVSSSVLVPHTAESQVLLSLPVPHGTATRARQTVDGTTDQPFSWEQWSATLDV